MVAGGRTTPLGLHHLGLFEKIAAFQKKNPPPNHHEKFFVVSGKLTVMAYLPRPIRASMRS